MNSIRLCLVGILLCFAGTDCQLYRRAELNTCPFNLKESAKNLEKCVEEKKILELEVKTASEVAVSQNKDELEKAEDKHYLCMGKLNDCRSTSVHSSHFSEVVKDFENKLKQCNLNISELINNNHEKEDAGAVRDEGPLGVDCNCTLRGLEVESLQKNLSVLEKCPKLLKNCSSSLTSLKNKTKIAKFKKEKKKTLIINVTLDDIEYSQGGAAPLDEIEFNEDTIANDTESKFSLDEAGFWVDNTTTVLPGASELTDMGKKILLR